eukprot:6513521-Prymnesium_polylepis.1
MPPVCLGTECEDNVRRVFLQACKRASEVLQDVRGGRGHVQRTTSITYILASQSCCPTRHPWRRDGQVDFNV